jgi:hypothetical protein
VLEHLLELLQEGRTRRVVDLAGELETTPQLVQAMLEELERMGRLVKVDGQCADRCGSCPWAPGCAAGNRGAVWSLVEHTDG